MTTLTQGSDQGVAVDDGTHSKSAKDFARQVKVVPAFDVRGINHVLPGEMDGTTEADATTVQRTRIAPSLNNLLDLLQHPDRAAVTEGGSRLNVDQLAIVKDRYAEICPPDVQCERSFHKTMPSPATC